MLIRAYRVESYRPGLLGLPLDTMHVAIVQITRNVSELSGAQREVQVLDSLERCFPELAKHMAHGSSTWSAKPIDIPDDELGTPTVEDISEGFRVWRRL
jgi:hypothetical protein